MAVTAFATGTQSTTGGGTEDFLSSPNVAGTFTLHLDLSDMDADDILIVRVYQKVLTGGTARIYQEQKYDGVQPTNGAITVSVPVSNDLAEANALRFSITQTSGGAISIPWKVLLYS